MGGAVYGFGGMELLIIGAILVINLLVPAALIIAAVVASRRSNGPTGPWADVRLWRAGTVWTLLAATAMPLVLGFLTTAAFVIPAIPRISAGQTVAPSEGMIVVYIALAVLANLLVFALTVIYVLLAVSSDLGGSAKALWALAVVFGGVLTLPFAFYFLVWNVRTQSAPPQLGVSNQTT